MSQYFELPCGCGKTVTISTAQAGAQVKCSCGTTLEAPKLRDLRSLKSAKPPAEKPTTRETAVSEVTVGRLFFAGCAIVAVLATLSASTFWQQRSLINLGPTIQQEAKMDGDFVASLSKPDAFDLWGTFSERGISGMPGSAWFNSRQEHARLTNHFYAAVAVAVAGYLIAAVTAMLTQPAQKRN